MMDSWQSADVMTSRHPLRHTSTPGGTHPINLTDPRLWYDSHKADTLVRDFSHNSDGVENNPYPLRSDIKGVCSGDNLSDNVDVEVSDMSADRRAESDTLPPIHNRQASNEASYASNIIAGVQDCKELESTGCNQDELPTIQSSPQIPESISHIFNNPLSAVTLPHIVNKKVERTPGMTSPGEYDTETTQKYNELRLPQHESKTKTLEEFRDTYVLRQKSNIKFKTDVGGNKRPHALGSGSTGNSADVDVNKRIATQNASNRKPFYKTAYPKVLYPHFHKRRGDINPLDGSFQPLSTAEAQTIGRPQPFQVDTVNPYRVKREQAVRFTQPDIDTPDKFMHIKLERNSYINHILTRSRNEQENDRKAAAIINLSMRESMSANDEKYTGTSPSHSMEHISSPRSLRSVGSSPSNEISTGYRESRPADSLLSSLSNTEGTEGKRRLYLRKFKKLEVFGESRRPVTSHRGRLTEENPNTTHNAPVLRPPNYRLDPQYSSSSWTDLLHTTQESINIMQPTKHSSRRNDTIDAPQKKLINLAGPPESDTVARTGTWHKGLASRRSIRLEVTFKQKRTRSIPDSGLIVQTPSTPIHGTSSLGPYTNEREGQHFRVNPNQPVASHDTMDLNSELDHASTSTALDNIEAYVPPNTVDTEKKPVNDQDMMEDAGMFTDAENTSPGESDQEMDIGASEDRDQLSADSLMDPPAAQNQLSADLLMNPPAAQNQLSADSLVDPSATHDRDVANTIESSHKNSSGSAGMVLEEQREGSDVRTISDTNA